MSSITNQIICSRIVPIFQLFMPKLLKYPIHKPPLVFQLIPELSGDPPLQVLVLLQKPLYLFSIVVSQCFWFVFELAQFPFVFWINICQSFEKRTIKFGSEQSSPSTLNNIRS